MNVTERRERLRAMIAEDRLIRPASVWDPLSARAAAAIGYDMMMLAGSTASLAVLGAPDLILLTLSEFADQAQRVGRAAALPLLVDADHGYGNALNVMRCVEELESAGVAALSIEDTQLPRPFGAQGESFLPVEEGAGKMRAAVAARSDHSLIIFARTGAVRGEGVDSLVARVKAYAATGVDGLFLVGVRTRAEVQAARDVTGLPFVLGGMTKELDDDAYLASMGVRIGGWNHTPIQAATRAAYDTLRAMRERSGGAVQPVIDSEKLMDVLMQSGSYAAAAERYLSRGGEMA